jgi:hypothetical protein
MEHVHEHVGKARHRSCAGRGGGVYVTGVPTAGVNATLIEMRAPSPGSMMPSGLATGVFVPASTSMKLRV